LRYGNAASSSRVTSKPEVILEWCFGIDGGSIKLPGQIEVDFPIGASLDAKRRIQLDSDYTGKGGVTPQVRIPRTYDNMLAVGQGQDVELKAAERELAKMLSSGQRFQPAR
jgi:carboxyl-terminal processing protease